MTGWHFSRVDRANLLQIARDEASPAKIPRPALRIKGNSILKSRKQNRATSLDNLPRINQRREVETDDATCSLIRIVVLNYGANNGVLNLAAVRVVAIAY